MELVSGVLEVIYSASGGGSGNGSDLGQEKLKLEQRAM